MLQENGPEEERAPSSMFATMYQPTERFGGFTVGQDAGHALDCNSNAWALLEDANWRTEFRDLVIEELAALNEGEGEEESAVHAQEKSYVEWLLSPDGLHTLRVAARDLASSRNAARMYDDQPRGSRARTCVRLLDRLVMELSRLGYEKSTRLVRRCPPVARCALCDLTMDCYAEDGSPLQPRGPPPYDRTAIEADGSELQSVEQQLRRSLVPSAAEPGWVLWHRLAPCGHVLHDHCSIKLQAAANQLPCCPAEGCGLACNFSLATSNWSFGKSVTLPEMDDRYSYLDPARLAKLDPRSTDALESWLALSHALETQGPDAPQVEMVEAAEADEEAEAAEELEEDLEISTSLAESALGHRIASALAGSAGGTGPTLTHSPITGTSGAAP